MEGLSLNNENRFILIDHNGSELLDTNKSKTGPSYSSSLENKSLLSSDSNTTYQVKLETFDHFNLIKESINETRPVYAKDNLDEQMLMFRKSIKIKDSNWQVVLKLGIIPRSFFKCMNRSKTHCIKFFLINKGGLSNGSFPVTDMLTCNAQHSHII